MELFIAKVYPEKIMIMGLWARNALLWYIRIQVSEPRKGISYLMTNKHALYTIPEADNFYHTPVKDNTESHRLNLIIIGR